MQVKTVALAAVLLTAPGLLHAQFDFKVAGKGVQVHSFASQGFAYSSTNNYLTMKTTQGSFAMTDGGVNVSTQLTDRFRVGAQMYLRNVGELGNWRPSLDWAVADYRFRDWFGIRAGKVKTTLGVFNDTQDMDFLQTFALLPQSIYPVDLRDSTIAHVGGDIYGNISIKKLGAFSYTVYGGRRRDSEYGGYPYALSRFGLHLTSYGGLQVGEDLRWNTPLKGLMVGASHMDEDISGVGALTLPNGRKIPFSEHAATRDTTSQFYVDYTLGNLRIDAEYRRYWRDHMTSNPVQPEASADSRSWYAAATYRISKKLELGAYRSWFIADRRLKWELPDNHLYDTTVAARVDVTSHWNFKVEGHFIDGYGAKDAVRGFYLQTNPKGMQPNTHLLMIRTGWNF